VACGDDPLLQRLHRLGRQFQQPERAIDRLNLMWSST
jgi:hypothetical protein